MLPKLLPKFDELGQKSMTYEALPDVHDGPTALSPFLICQYRAGRDREKYPRVERWLGFLF